jgi:hypothetical protein
VLRDRPRARRVDVARVGAEVAEERVRVHRAMVAGAVERRRE